ncbi:MAG: amidohydrolase family protein [Candidatus Methylomirabilia bacterium]
MMVHMPGEDRFNWAPDYPHVDASFGAVRRLKERMGGLPDTAKRKLLGRNAARLYGLEGSPER